MKFSNDYWHSLDKENASRYELNPGILGISTPPFRDQLESLKTRIFQGASQVELGFTGKGKGSATQGSITPEQISSEEREQIRLLSKINRVELSTHNTVGVGSLSGFDERARGFDKESQEANLQELRRTIDFAADVVDKGQGGPIVVHTGEFPRPIFKFRDEKFEGYPKEEEHAPVHLADPETGQVMSLKRDIKIWEPKRDENTKQPLINPQTGEFEWEEKEKKFADFEKEFEEIKKQNPQRAEEEFKDSAGVYFYKKYAEREILHRKGEIDYYLERAEDAQRRAAQEPRLKAMADHFREAAVAIGRQIKEQEKQLNRILPIEEVGKERSAEAIARGALYAMEKEKATGFEKPLFIAPENIFPENGYGSHPQELKELIQASRKAMKEKLWNNENQTPTRAGEQFNISSQQDAEKAAEDHIKATFDIGHLNTWRKFFKGSDAEFNDWVGKQIDSLQEKKMIGHAHITDNFGYFDEHVTPGEGTAPIAGFIKKLKESEFKGKMIIEPGHQDVKAWTGALKAFHSPVYRVDGQVKSWTEVEHSYFSRTASPSYMVGGVTPGAGLSEEYNDWRFWSRLPIE